jgi:hypothetical protein
MDRLISEKAVLEAFREYQGSISDFYKAVKAIPSAEPKTGHWIDGGEYICFSGRQKAPCICSVCRKSALNEPWYYCPNCGTRMVEPQESEG